MQECADVAIHNNITVRQRENASASTKADVLQSKLSLLPSVNGQATHNYNTGFAINPATNQAEQDVTFRNNSFSLNANLTLFNGFQQQNNVRLQRSNLRATEQDVQSTRNTITLSVANAYLQVLMNTEILENNRLQAQATRQQLIKQEKLVELGAANRVRLLQLRAQVANEELLIINSRNLLAQSYLQLWQLMNIEPDTSARIVKPEIDADQIGDEPMSANEIYTGFVNRSPDVQAARHRLRSSEIQRYVALGGRSPRISMNAGLSSFYSTQTLRPVGTPLTTITPVGIDINGQPVVSSYTSYNTFEVTPFSNQFDRNLGKSLGFTFFLPIFNGWQTNTAIQKSKIGQMNAQLGERQAQTELYKTISQAHQDFASARKKYEAAGNSFQANKESLALAEAQFNAGAISTTDYVNIKNDFLKAQGTYLQAKYELVFSRKVLDFYSGKPLY